MRSSTQKLRLSLREMMLYPMLGAILLISYFIMQALPNIHLLALLITVYTLSFRAKALIPLYIYVLLNGVIYGFSPWWIPYLYIWLPLWGAVMLVSKLPMKRKLAVPVYMLICGLHGLGFGLLYAPAQALMFKLSFKAMIAWIIAGFPFDLMHGISNFCVASLTLPLYALMEKQKKALR